MEVSFALDGLPVELVGVVSAELFDASDVPLDASGNLRSCL